MVEPFFDLQIYALLAEGSSLNTIFDQMKSIFNSNPQFKLKFIYRNRESLCCEILEPQLFFNKLQHLIIYSYQINTFR